jgi:hypothetical protein
MYNIDWTWMLGYSVAQKNLQKKWQKGENTLQCKQKICHSLTIFDICETLIYHGGCLKNILYLRFSINGGTSQFIIVSWNSNKYEQLNY